MINPTTKNTSISGGTVLETAEYHIAPSATAHVTSLLRNMYSEPLQAVVREYVANAIDAHTHAGVDKPLLIHAPSSDEPWFAVRDYGHGLDKGAQVQYLLGYGESGEHKRISNDQIGGFGIGCKSGFAVADTFTYTIWHGGMQYVWSCFLDENDLGKANLVSEQPSDEPTGIEVKIPLSISDYSFRSNFQDALNKALSFTTTPYKLENNTTFEAPTTYSSLVQIAVECMFDGEPHKIIYHWGISSFGGPKIIMGTSAFIIDNTHYASIKPKIDLSNLEGIEVPIGFLALAPSRESLQYSQRTLKLLKALFQHIEESKMREEAKSILRKQQKAFGLAKQARINYVWDMHWDFTNTPGICNDGMFLWIPPEMASARWNGSLYVGCYGGWMKSAYFNSQERFLVPTGPQDRVPYADYPENEFWYIVPQDTPKSQLLDIALRLWTWLLRDREPRRVTQTTVNILATDHADEIPWLHDGSVQVVDQIAEDHDPRWVGIEQPRTAKTRATKISRPNPRATKVLRYQGPLYGTNCAGDYWEKAPWNQLPDGVKYYVPLNQMMVNVGDRLVLPDNLSHLQEVLRHVMPEMTGIFGVRVNDVETLRDEDQWVLLWDGMIERVRIDHNVNADMLYRLFWLLQNSWINWTGSQLVNSPDVIDMLCQRPPKLNKVTKEFYRLMVYDDSDEQTKNWAVAFHLAVRRFDAWNGKSQLDLPSMLAIPESDTLATWAQNNDGPLTDHKRTDNLSPVDKVIRNFITRHPIIAGYWGLSLKGDYNNTPYLTAPAHVLTYQRTTALGKVITDNFHKLWRI